MLNQLKLDLKNLENNKKAKIYSKFFKTAPGEYSYGDLFLGISVPDQRKIAQKYINLEFEQVKQLLPSKVHEHRLTALLILVERFKTADEKNKKEIADFYLNNINFINNWDLVDLSADKILGKYLIDKDKYILYKLAKSNNLWERRIAIIATFAFIRNNEFEDTLKISKVLLNDNHDLIQKAVGWMLREIGKRNQEVEEEFLIKNYKNMPRTTLRYAIERLPENKKSFYLKKEKSLNI